MLDNSDVINKTFEDAPMPLCFGQKKIWSMVSQPKIKQDFLPIRALIGEMHPKATKDRKSLNFFNSHFYSDFCPFLNTLKKLSS